MGLSGMDIMMQASVFSDANTLEPSNQSKANMAQFGHNEDYSDSLLNIA